VCGGCGRGGKKTLFFADHGIGVDKPLIEISSVKVRARIHRKHLHREFIFFKRAFKKV